MTSIIPESPASDSTSAEIIYTPAESESQFPQSHLVPASSQRRNSPSPLRLSSLPAHVKRSLRPGIKKSRDREEDIDNFSDSDLELSEFSDMSSSRPPMHRPSDGHSQLPLLGGDKDTRGRSSSLSAPGSKRPSFAARRNTFRSRSPTYVEPANLTRRKYIYAAFFLVLSLVSFVVQTETAVYIQHTLGWKKAYCMLWLTHSSWSVLWPTQLLIIRIQKRKLSWPAFWRRHKYLVRTTAQMVRYQQLDLDANSNSTPPWGYFLRTTAFVTTFLTIAGSSWYVAVNMTSPSDLTAIYNCSAFFAYVFSILLLHDKLRLDKMFSVGLAIAGVLVVAYGDKDAPKTPGHSGGSAGGKPGGDSDEDFSSESRLVGNLIIGVGSVLYGLYEVLYKKLACPPEGTSPGRGMIFANTFGSMIGFFTLTILWIPLIPLHFTGIEPFELPRGETAWMLAISTLSNAVFSGSFLVLMSLTSPVLSSVAALLTIFLVAIVDWMITNKPLSGAAIGGGSLIIVAFAMLSWATYREMNEETRRREKEEQAVLDSGDEDEADLGEDDGVGVDEDTVGRR